MFDIFQHTTRPAAELFFRKNDADDVRLGEIISQNHYEESEIVILACPQDEGVRRNGGRVGAAFAPEAIRRQFYKLTTLGISVKTFDLGDTIIKNSLEATHDSHTQIVEQVLRDGKKIIALGGGNDISYADGCALANFGGADGWLAFNIDQHFDVRADEPRNSGTPYRQLLDENRIAPANFYEMGYQEHSNSPVHLEYLRSVGATAMSWYEIGYLGQSATFQRILENSSCPNVFWGFDVDVVNAADAPGVSAPSPIGLSAIDFCELARSAGSWRGTKIIEFSEMNPNFDVDQRTAKLVAVAMHRFLSAVQ
ncbi:MAG: formimidoylglutamase [Acidobacteriota bacterium]|nr:formimidoylglutamase [Acidobacteriota bacterium]